MHLGLPKTNSIVRLLLVVTIFAGHSAIAGCETAALGYETEGYFHGTKMRYRVEKIENRKEIDVARFLPEHERETSVIVGFDSAHIYVWYKGYRFDSKGRGGIRVKTKILHTERIYGNIIVIVRNLEPAQLAEMNRWISEFQKKNLVSCGQDVCDKLSDIGIRNSWSWSVKPSAAFTSLAQHKINGANVELISLDGRKLEKSVSEIRGYEHRIAFLYYFYFPTLGTLSFSAALITIGVVISAIH